MQFRFVSFGLENEKGEQSSYYEHKLDWNQSFEAQFSTLYFKIQSFMDGSDDCVKLRQLNEIHCMLDSCANIEQLVELRKKTKTIIDA